MTTLYSPIVKTLLVKLYREANIDESFMAVAPEVGKLCYVLVRSLRPSLIVEFGTSHGLSAIQLAAGIRDNGVGRLVSTEIKKEKVIQAQKNLAAAELQDLVEIRCGNACETLIDIEGIDMLFLDGWKPLYLELLKQLEPKMSAHCLVIADDTLLFATELASYLAHVRDPRNGYLSCAIPMDDGIEISFR